MQAKYNVDAAKGALMVARSGHMPSRYNRPESIATGDRHPRARYRCDAEGPLLNRPCIGRILFAVAHRIDMSEYQEKHSVSRLVGAPPERKRQNRSF